MQKNLRARAVQAEKTAQNIDLAMCTSAPSVVWRKSARSTRSAGLTPGFEHRLSKPSLVLTYALFAAGLALGGIAARRMG